MMSVRRKITIWVLCMAVAMSLMWNLQVFKGEGFRVYSLCYIPPGRPEMFKLKVKPEPINATTIRKGIYGGASIAGLRAGPALIYNHGGTSLRVYEESGSFVFDTLISYGPWDEWQGGSMQAGQLMQDYVLRTGGFPESIEFDQRVVHKQGLFVTGYTYIFRQWFRGYPALGYGGLRVTLGNGELVHMLRSLRSIEGEEGPFTVISARQAINVAVKNMQVCTQSSKRFYLLGVRLGYFALWPEVHQKLLEPVWEIRFQGHTIYVNALTKEIMFGDGSKYSTE